MPPPHRGAMPAGSRGFPSPGLSAGDPSRSDVCHPSSRLLSTCMGDTYACLHYHLVFSTKNRESWINDIQRRVRRLARPSRNRVRPALSLGLKAWQTSLRDGHPARNLRGLESPGYQQTSLRDAVWATTYVRQSAVATTGAAPAAYPSSLNTMCISLSGQCPGWNLKAGEAIGSPNRLIKTVPPV